MTLSQESRHCPWIALVVGNSRLHWFYYQGLHIINTWDTPHASIQQQPQKPSSWPEWQQYAPALAYHPSEPIMPELWMASVVPSQTLFWQQYPQIKILTTQNIPIRLPYSTFGLDRALAIWTAGQLYQWPVLVIDAGTALTYTGATSATQCIGGGILPGVGLQLRSLTEATPELPCVSLPDQLPSRWFLETSAAIQSGILHTLISGLADNIHAWLQQYPTSTIVFTGGDASILHQALSQSERLAASILTTQIVLDLLLQGRGIQCLRTLTLDVGHEC